MKAIDFALYETVVFQYAQTGINKLCRPVEEPFFYELYRRRLSDPVGNLLINGKGKDGGWFGCPRIRK